MQNLKRNTNSSNLIPSLLFYSLIFLLGSASLSKSAGLFSDSIKQVEFALGGAIFLHLSGTLLLGFLAHLSNSRRILLGVSINAVFLIALVILDESLQYILPARHFSWLDMSVNIVGVLFGNYCAFFILRNAAVTK